MKDTDAITEAVNEANIELEENRKAFERLKELSNQIHKEVEQNKEQRILIEKRLDALYFQIQQKNLS